MRCFHRRRQKISQFLFLLVIAVVFPSSNASDEKKRAAHERLKLIYEAVAEGNDHAQALKSVEDGLGGSGVTVDTVLSSLKVKKESKVQVHSAGKETDVEKGAEATYKDVLKDPPPSLSSFSSSSVELLHDMKAQVLSKLEHKIREELEKETAILGQMTARSSVEKQKEAATAVYKIVREKLSALPWVSVELGLRKDINFVTIS